MTEEPTPEQIERERLLSVFEEYYSVPGPDQDEYYDRDGLIDGLVAVAAAGAAPQEPAEGRESLKRVAELASAQHIKESIEEFKEVTSPDNEPNDWEMEFWHAGYKRGALAIIDHQYSAPMRVDEAKLAEVLLDHAMDFDQSPRPAGPKGSGYVCECGLEILEPRTGSGIGWWHRKHLASEVAEWLRGGGR
ncbi:hypothetical protein ACFSWE_09625 [Leucobacter albus]|uniref:Uncharacterized protein n=1 Tax=Leucobacter albus TaxID=272210 RepID=A0ABW3TV07_9MICO